MKKHIPYFLFLPILCLLLSACDPERIFDENITVPEGTWNKDSVARFDVQVSDTLSSYNVYVNIRHNGKYRNNNLFLFITIKGPDGSFLRDTFDCPLADDKGVWFGSGIGDLFNNQVIYKRNVKFPRSGNYIFEYEQAMRTDNLKNIEDIGLRIEKMESGK